MVMESLVMNFNSSVVAGMMDSHNRIAVLVCKGVVLVSVFIASRLCWWWESIPSFQGWLHRALGVFTQRILIAKVDAYTACGRRP
jgi:hypothetical protein